MQSGGDALPGACYLLPFHPEVLSPYCCTRTKVTVLGLLLVKKWQPSRTMRKSMARICCRLSDSKKGMWPGHLWKEAPLVFFNFLFHFLFQLFSWQAVYNTIDRSYQWTLLPLSCKDRQCFSRNITLVGSCCIRNGGCLVKDQTCLALIAL